MLQGSLDCIRSSEYSTRLAYTSFKFPIFFPKRISITSSQFCWLINNIEWLPITNKINWDYWHYNKSPSRVRKKEVATYLTVAINKNKMWSPGQASNPRTNICTIPVSNCVKHVCVLKSCHQQCRFIYHLDERYYAIDKLNLWAFQNSAITILLIFATLAWF